MDLQQAPWFDLAQKYLNEHEIAGPKKNNQFILDCFKHTSYKASNDEVPWCAAFMCRILDESGMKTTGRADAKSYNQYGSPSELKPGAILVFQWPSGHHHVTLCHHVIDDKYVACLGGNQSDSVKISVFEKKYIQTIHWPVKAQK